MAPSNKLNLAGQRFGKLIAIKDTGKRYRGLAIWQCKCELQLLQIGGTAEKCCRLYFRQKKRAGGRWCGKDRTTPV